MALYAIGDVQGCDGALAALLERLHYSPDRDRLCFVGDLVNRGPDSLGVLRRVRALGDAAITTLGNHDLHLLAVAFGSARLRGGDTLQEVLDAPDRDLLLEWLLQRPVLHEEPALRMVLLHAGLPPQWDIATARACARELEAALRTNPQALFSEMYGDEPDLWNESLRGGARLRYIANCFTRLRYLDPQDRLALRAKGSPNEPKARGLVPWFEAKSARWRTARVVFGHWSTLGYLSTEDVLSLDTGCVWGGSLTAVRLDEPAAPPVSVDCATSR